MQSVSSLVVDPSNDVIAIGNSEGDIKIYSCEPNPQLMYSLPGEHAAKTGFSFRQVLIPIEKSLSIRRFDMSNPVD